MESRRHDVWTLGRVFRDGAAALATGMESSLDLDTPDHSLVRMPLHLDEQGWHGAQAICDHLYAQLLVARREASERLERAGELGVAAVAGLLLFRHPRGWNAGLGGAIPGSRPPKRIPVTSLNHGISVVDPLRVRVLEALLVEQASCSELAERFGVPLERIRYQVEELEQRQMIKLHGERQRRGCKERVYVGEPRNVITDRLPEAPEKARFRASQRYLLTAISRNAVEAMRASDLRRGVEDSTALRLSMALDAPGFRVVFARCAEAVYRLFDLRDECLQRRLETAEPARLAVASIIFHELPSTHPLAGAVERR